MGQNDRMDPIDTSLRPIGYWRSSEAPELPDPSDHVDLGWDAEERRNVGTYLSGGRTPPWAFDGWSTCRICGAKNSAQEFIDGVYLWPEGLAHYVLEHSVRMPQHVVDHVNERRASSGTEV
jgi:hypothetical protein